MLKLEKIVKVYSSGDTAVEALKGVSLNFRANEFVSILGPSGCGKTTLLNIIGGLDKYTSGDLIINGVSTKEFSDRDWDIYRNHRVGFIFQSYNLIPHQTVLENVELALTIAGLEKDERVARAKKALDRVGLEGLYNKKPNQMSGGQCQRVAIARALVNEPEILLADEPTGALDTTTSVQIMELIKEISKEKLVIMVTHNPEIAEQYSTRIVRLLDGEVSSDSNICENEEEAKDSIKISKETEKAKMSLWTSFKLSGRNLLSKFKRTLLVGIAGSIGIIGVSLVLALSSGIRGYIDTLQEDMLSGNPIMITETTYDINSLMSSMTTLEQADIVIKNGIVSVNSIMETLAKRAETMTSLIVSNEITKEYISYLDAMPKEYLETIKYDYGIDITNNIYTEFKHKNGEDGQYTSLSAIKNIYKSLLLETDFSASASIIGTLSDPISQVINNEEYIYSQYDLLEGKMAKEKNEIMIVIDKNSQITDLTLAQLGYYSEEGFLNLAFKAFESVTDAEYDESLIQNEFPYEELLGKSFRWYSNDQIFKKETNQFLSMYSPFTYDHIVTDEFEEGLELEVVGILRPKAEINFGSLSTGFYYTEALTEYMLEQNQNSEIVKYMKENNKTTITGTSIKAENGSVINMGITYQYEYGHSTNNVKTTTGFVGSMSLTSLMSGMLGGMMGNPSGMSASDIYTLSVRDLGGEKLPNSIYIYPKDFDLKEKVLSYMNAWNEDGDITVKYENELEDGTIEYIEKILSKDERSEITHTDTLSIVISMINTMITIITTALIAFTAISLVVSTVMIGIITYVSVVERTKEIGVIRSLGGRKKDVAHLFNAETFIIGLFAGLIGIVVTYIISFIANIIIGSLTGIYTLVTLKWNQALIMITISVVLTLFSGIIPSKSAANMDPVNALRTE